LNSHLLKRTPQPELNAGEGLPEGSGLKVLSSEEERQTKSQARAHAAAQGNSPGAQHSSHTPEVAQEEGMSEDDGDDDQQLVEVARAADDAIRMLAMSPWRHSNCDMQHEEQKVIQVRPGGSAEVFGAKAMLCANTKVALASPLACVILLSAKMISIPLSSAPPSNQHHQNLLCDAEPYFIYEWAHAWIWHHCSASMGRRDLL
jgi:hypothetical protein